jgi:hypothetical protein
VTLARVSDLPPHDVLRASVAAAGQLLLVCASAREASSRSTRELIVWRSTESGGWDDSAITTAFRRPFIQPAPERGLLAVDAHSHRQASGVAQANAEVHDSSGALAHSFVAGDGIVDVQTTSSGMWVAYSDLGTTGDFGLFGWGRLSREVWVDPIGYDGLVRFDWNGVPESSAVPPAPSLPIIDCFALNVSNDDVWACSYPDYPLVHVDLSGDVRSWSGIELPVTAVAVSPPDVLLARMIPGQPLRAWRATLGAAALENVESVRLELADPGDGPIRQLFARGDALHAVTDRAWYRAPVATRPTERSPHEAG